MTVPHPPRMQLSDVELRRYTLHPGTRDTLIALFDRHFLEGQEEHGMSVLGQFRDLDDPDAFVWMRGFVDMEARRQALAGFYAGPVWLQHRDAANATMTAFDDVYLLRPSQAGGGLDVETAQRPAPDAVATPDTVFVANVLTPRDDVDAFAAWHRETMQPLIREAGAQIAGTFVTEVSENSYPRLPIRSDRVFVVISRFADITAADRSRAVLAASASWGEAAKHAATLVVGPPRTLRLAPTARSALR